MLILYTVPVSLYCAKTRIVLRQKGLAWEERGPDGGYGSDAYKTRVPSGNLPALVDGDLTLCDSETINEYLEEAHPAPAMLPVGRRARAMIRDRSRFHDTRLEPALRLLFPHVAPATRDRAAVDAAERAIAARLDQAEALLAMGSGADGGRLTLGDCGFAVTLPWIALLAEAMDLTLPLPPGIAAHHSRLAAMPAVAAELAAYRPAMERWLAEKGA